jgi:hypothetical protein
LLVGRNLRLQDNGAGLIDNANRQKSGVQIDTAVELVLFGVEPKQLPEVNRVNIHFGPATLPESSPEGGV